MREDQNKLQQKQGACPEQVAMKKPRIRRGFFLRCATICGAPIARPYRFAVAM
jgi:hypothetical protein